MAPIIRTEKLRKVYAVGKERVVALNNVDLSIEKGEFCCIVGQSGSGKSTLLKSLNRMNDLVEGCRITGQVLLDGEDIYGDMIPQFSTTRVTGESLLPDPVLQRLHYQLPKHLHPPQLDWHPFPDSHHRPLQSKPLSQSVQSKHVVHGLFLRNVQ